MPAAPPGPRPGRWRGGEIARRKGSAEGPKRGQGPILEVAGEAVEPMVGIEPTTYGLRNRCSTTELHWRAGAAWDLATMRKLADSAGAVTRKNATVNIPLAIPPQLPTLCIEANLIHPA